MMRDDVITLISEIPGAHGALETPEMVERDVFCRVRSAGYREFYMAKAAGLNPEYVFTLSQDFEYQGEPICRFHGVTYRIIRTYITEMDGIELTVERSWDDAGQAQSGS